MSAGQLALAVTSGGFGFLFADALDRFLATYNPSGTERPKDKFTSDGAGTLANTLNIASRPGLVRIGAGVGVTAVPAIGSMFVRNPYAKASLEGMAIGAGINLVKSLWSNFLMPMLIGKDVSVPTLQKSYIARLYPAEVSAKINLDQKMTSVSSSGSGALSGAQGRDVGPFALAAESPYPDAAQALRRETGVRGDSPYPSASQALRAGVHGDSPYPDAAQALRAGVSYAPGPPDGPGPGPQAAPHTDPACGCVGDPTSRYSAFLGEPSQSESFVR